VTHDAQNVSMQLEAAARQQGRDAAWAGKSIHSCPHKPLPLAAAWRNGWSEAREHRREKEQKEYEAAINPPGMIRSTQIGQRMSRETMIERFGERFL
jgi:ribosome modulation factor